MELCGQMADNLHPDVIVMDLMMPECNGLGGYRQVLRTDHRVRIILTTLQDYPSFTEQARSVGACGVSLKRVRTAIDSSIRVATQNGLLYFARSRVCRLIEITDLARVFARDDRSGHLQVAGSPAMARHFFIPSRKIAPSQ